MRVRLRSRRGVVAALAVVAAAAAAVIPLTRGGKTRPLPPSAVVSRGTVAITVGGVGRVVEAAIASQVPVPAQPGGSATASATTATAAPNTAPSDAVFPTVSG